MCPNSQGSNWLRIATLTVVVPIALCALSSVGSAQKSQNVLASAERLSEYVIQGTVNDQRLQYLLQDPSSAVAPHSELMEALAEQNAAWSALLERMDSWKPTPQDLQQQIPQRLAQLVSLAHSSLLQSVRTLKTSHQYSWLAKRLVASLANVNTLQARLKEAISPEPPPKSGSKVPARAKK
jgi:hypothetical protein